MHAGLIEICDFCRTQRPGEILVRNDDNTAHICEHCVPRCVEAIQEEKSRCAKPS